MHSFLALAGLAEMAIASDLKHILAGVIVASVLGVVSWWRRSWVLSLVALGVCVVIGGFYEPWQDFLLSPPSPLDPDEVYWSFRCRVVGVIWILCSVGCSACLAFAIWRRRLHLDTI